jgi:hypothetical protein
MARRAVDPQHELLYYSFGRRRVAFLSKIISLFLSLKLPNIYNFSNLYLLLNRQISTILIFTLPGLKSQVADV